MLLCCRQGLPLETLACRHMYATLRPAHKCNHRRKCLFTPQVQVTMRPLLHRQPVMHKVMCVSHNKAARLVNQQQSARASLFSTTTAVNTPCSICVKCQTTLCAAASTTIQLVVATTAWGSKQQWLQQQLAGRSSNTLYYCLCNSASCPDTMCHLEDACLSRCIRPASQPSQQRLTSSVHSLLLLR
jgi:hypothetical protein